MTEAAFQALLDGCADPFADFNEQGLRLPPTRTEPTVDHLCACGAGLDSMAEGQSGLCNDCLDKQWSKYGSGQ